MKNLHFRVFRINIYLPSRSVKFQRAKATAVQKIEDMFCPKQFIFINILYETNF